MEIIQAKRMLIRHPENENRELLALLDVNYNTGYNFASMEPIEGEVTILRWIDKRPNYFCETERGFTLVDYLSKEK
jgi:hypothetical protein